MGSQISARRRNDRSGTHTAPTPDSEFDACPGVSLDGEKEQANRRKHGVGFYEASTIFGDPFEYTIADPDHSVGEYRFLSMGLSVNDRILVVS